MGNECLNKCLYNLIVNGIDLVDKSDYEKVINFLKKLNVKYPSKERLTYYELKVNEDEDLISILIELINSNE